MDPKLQELVARTNLDELLSPVATEINLNQPVQTTESAPAEVARSTTDPLQVHFATADILGKLQDSPTSSGMKTFAVVFLAGPFVIFGLMLIGMAWSNPGVGLVRQILGTIVGLGIAGFWPYIIFSRRRKRPTH